MGIGTESIAVSLDSRLDRLFKQTRFLRRTAGALVGLGAFVFLVFFFFSWPTNTNTEIPLSNFVSLAVEGRVQELRVQEISGKSASGSSQVRFTALLDDGSEVIGRAENADAIQSALERAGVADVEGLLRYE